ncbi:MAG: HD domain-containing protein [Oscillospiraceae bacterium]|nr:HD domain-containing protein [Oscillospiraceae bacterium]
MQRVNAILEHPLFQASMEKNRESETNSAFCTHDMAHARDVARIGYILNLEQGLGISKEVIYAAALLHDITKWLQHAEGVPHNESAIEPATRILQDCGFGQGEIAMICEAILHHRRGPEEPGMVFAALLFQADKLSRACYLCDSREACNWEMSKQNAVLRY